LGAEPLFREPSPWAAAITLAKQIVVKAAVKEKLYAPATARFSDIRYTQVEDDTWIVCGYVDAQNLFGALIRQRFYCTLKYLGNDKWQAIDVFIFPG